MSGTQAKGIVFNRSDPLLESFSDSDWAGCSNRKSHTGYVIKMSGGGVAWEAKKQPTVALSSTEAEYMALASAAKELLYLQNLIDELDIGFMYNLGKVELKVDNKGAISLASNNGYSGRTKHINVRHQFIRELVDLGRIELYYVNTKENFADICTKALNHSTHIYLRDLIVQDVCK